MTLCEHRQRDRQAALTPSPARPVVGLLAVISGAGMATVYLPQPLLPMIAADLRISPAAAGLVISATQLGLLLSIVGVLPLVDRLAPRRLLVTLLGTGALALVLAAQTTGLLWLALLSLGIGATAIVAQSSFPLAAALAPDATRGRVLGSVQGGMLLGILLVRVLGGVSGSVLGWRSVYLALAGVLVSLSVLGSLRLPTHIAAVAPRTGAVSHLSWRLLLRMRAVRQACGYGALIFGAYSAFWATVAVAMAQAHPDAPQIVGMLGLIGIGGIVAARQVGRLLDRWGTRATRGMVLATVLLAFVPLSLGPNALGWFFVGALLLDAGSQASQVVNQARLFAGSLEARGALNTVYMSATYAGGVVGALAGFWAWEWAGWFGVCAVGVVLAGCALMLYLARCRRPSPVA